MTVHENDYDNFDYPANFVMTISTILQTLSEWRTNCILMSQWPFARDVPSSVLPMYCLNSYSWNGTTCMRAVFGGGSRARLSIAVMIQRWKEQDISEVGRLGRKATPPISINNNNDTKMTQS